MELPSAPLKTGKIHLLGGLSQWFEGQISGSYSGKVSFCFSNICGYQMQGTINHVCTSFLLDAGAAVILSHKGILEKTTTHLNVRWL